MKWIYLLSVALGMLAVTGCSSQPPTQVYVVVVTNRLSEPMTVWLTKLKSPYPDGWTPPEMLALDPAAEVPQQEIVPPGETRGIKRKTPMEYDNAAELRVYKTTDYNKILAISPGSPDRLDIILRPNHTTDLEIIQRLDRLEAVPHIPSTRSTTQPKGP